MSLLSTWVIIILITNVTKISEWLIHRIIKYEPIKNIIKKSSVLQQLLQNVLHRIGGESIEIEVPHWSCVFINTR